MNEPRPRVSCRQNRARREWNASDFWVIWGKHLKITDTLLVVVTLVLALATVALWRATTELVTGEHNTAKRQLRAYIGVAIGRVEKFSSSTLVEGSVIVKNFGQTPAYNLVQTSVLLPARFPFVGSVGELLSNAGPAKTLALLNPMQDFLAGGISQRLYTDDEISKINDGREWRLYLVGTITYRDAFGEPHYTNFCFDHSGETIRTNRGVDICDFYGAD